MFIVPNLGGEEKIYYLRKSRSDSVLQTVEETLTKHEQMLDELMHRIHPERDPVPECNRYREVGSGETIESRTAIKEVLKRVESPNINAIVCVEPSRLSRGDLEDIGYLVKILRYTNTLVITLNYTFDLTDERDRDMFERELMKGNDYLEYQKKIQLNGRLLSVQNGNYISPNAPYGYKKVQYKENKRTVHTLEVIPEEAEVIKKIFDWYCNGDGAVKICKKLEAECIPSPQGDLSWSPHSIRGILDNIHYTGKVKWGSRPTQISVTDGDIKKSRPKIKDFLICDGLHEAIISDELWNKAQEKRGTNPRNPYKYNNSNILAGLVKCGKCGRTMSVHSYTKRCRARLECPDSRICKNASSVAEDVYRDVANVLRQSIADFEVEIKKPPDNVVEEHNKQVARLEKRIEELKALEIKQWDEKIKGDIPTDVFNRLNKNTVDEIERTKEALTQMKATPTPTPTDFNECKHRFSEALSLMTSPNPPIKELNNLLKSCIKQITYTKEMVSTRGRIKKGEETEYNLVFELKI